jgi:hypothetical protein
LSGTSVMRILSNRRRTIHYIGRLEPMTSCFWHQA